jgi:putative endonuclease
VSRKVPCGYILASKRDGILYIGVTSFTKTYSVKHLVYYEIYLSMDEAIRREKRLKEWRRAWKVRLIETMNPEWRDLFDPETEEIAMGPADLARGSG